MNGVTTPISGWNWLVDGKTMMIAFEGYWVSLCYPKPLVQLWWFVLGDEVQLKHALWLYWLGVGMMM